MDRLKEKWNKERRFSPILSGADEEFMKFYNARAKQSNSEQKENFFGSLMDHCEEIIVGKDMGGNFTFDLILRSLDTKTLEIVVERMLEVSGFEDIEDVKTHFAIAMIKEVPIFGNTEEISKEIESIQEEIITRGFFIKTEGKKQLFKLSRYNSIDFEKNAKVMETLARDHSLNLGEIKILKRSLSGNFNPDVKASKFINGLQKAIEGFEVILETVKRDEERIQKHLLSNYILFGTDYKRIIPKHRLGNDFIMDYALEKFDGTFELVEIEASNLRLYTKDGNPTSALIHAEQQILDWQEWLEKNNAYARNSLPEISNPKGYVIIGRDVYLTNSTRIKLSRRNSTYNGKIQILTYDGLLQKGKVLLKNIIGN